MAPGPSAAAWMLGLRDRALEWVRRQQAEGETERYARLILAFGLAKAGADGEARDILAEGALRLDAAGDEAHRWLAAAFRYRIEEGPKIYEGTLNGKPVTVYNDTVIAYNRDDQEIFRTTIEEPLHVRPGKHANSI